MTTATAPDLAVLAATPSDRRRLALLAGAASLLLALVAFPANLAVLQFSAAASAGEALGWVGANETVLRASVLGFVLAAILDVVLAWLLTRFLERPGAELPRLAGWLRVAYSAGLLVAAGLLAQAPRAASEEAAAAAVGGFSTVWSIALVLFAAHLLVLGAALLRTPRIPRVLGILILAAGASYGIDGAARILVADLGVADAVLTGVVSVTAIVGELGLAAWLLVRGGRR